MEYISLLKLSDERKYITITALNGKKYRNRKLYPSERFTKEVLNKNFELNEQQARIEILLFVIQMSSNEDRNNNQWHYPLKAFEG